MKHGGTMDNNSYLEIIADFDTFSVINKPAGMLSVPGRKPDHADSVTRRFQKKFPKAISHPEVHRLDMATSRLMVLAKTKKSHRQLSIQFQKRKVSKLYEALIEGKVEKDSGIIELPSRLDINNRPYQIYDEIHGKIGITHWKKISFEKNYTRVEFTPLTGRTHQLRVHSAHKFGLGFPIAGDLLYGNGTNPYQLKLHAKYLAFKNPENKDSLEFYSKVPF